MNIKEVWNDLYWDGKEFIENYTKLTLKRICKENNICFTYDWSLHDAFLASFEPIKKEVIEQVAKELGAYIKNENC